MLVGYLKFEIHAAGNYHKVKNIQVMLQSGFSLSVCVCESIQVDPGQFNTTHLVPYNSLANLYCYGNLF